MIQITRHLLKNNTTLLLCETHQAPVVSINIGIRVGSRYETQAEAGICHLIEHMLFKGTRQLGPGELAKQIEASGGDVNAYTSFDETVYYCTLSSRYREKGLNIMADAVLNSVIDPVELKREKEVVVEEILRGKDNPGRMLSQAIFSKVYAKHPYGRPIIGFEKNVREFSRQKILKFYHQHYTPKNMVVVVAGDFSTPRMLKQCENLFGSLKNKNAPREKIFQRQEKSKPQGIVLRKPVQGSSIMLAFPTPELEHGHIPALDILSHILGEGESSRLDDQVKERQGLVTSIHSHVYAPAKVGLMTFSYAMAEKNILKANAAVIKEIKRIKENKVSYDELNRAKLNIKSDDLYQRETVEGLAKKYGYYETILGRYDFEEHYYNQIDSISREDVLNVAQKYLNTNSLTLGLIHPKNSKQKWKPTQLIASIKENKKPIRKTKHASEEVTYLKLKNGLRLILKENHHVPIVILRSAHLGGLRSETPKTNGINALLGQIWGKSTKKLDAAQLARQVELTAGSLDSYVGKNVTGMKADFLSEKLHEGTALFLEALLKPRFDKKEIAQEKINILEAIRREEDALSSLAFKQFLKTLYPHHPYGMPLLGTKKTVSSFKLQDLIRVFQRSLNPQQIVIAAVGDFETPTLLEQLAPALETIPRQKHLLKSPKMAPAPTKVRRVERQLEKFQAHIVYGFRGARFKDQDRYALDTLNNILSGQGGQLFLELRDKMSLAYSVTSLSQEGIEPGYFGVYIGTEGSKVETAIKAIETELQKVLSKKVTQADLDRAKQYMIGAYEIELQRNAAVASQLLFNEIYGINREEWKTLPQKIMKVTRDDVARVAKKVLKLDRAVISVVRPK